MSHPIDAQRDAESRRLRRDAGWYTATAVVFGLLAWSGADMMGEGVDGLSIPTFIVGAAGSLGSLVLLVAVRRQRSRLAGPPTTVPAGRPRMGARGAARLSMAVAAVAAVTTGVALAPTGMDRGFVITVAAILAGALAFFALCAGGSPPPRTGTRDALYRVAPRP